MVSTFPSISHPTPRKTYAKLPSVLEVPNLVQVQLDSFKWFQEQGLRELLQDISPIQDFTGSRLEIYFKDYHFRQPKYTEPECRQREITYSAPLYITIHLLVKETGEIKERQELFFGDFPVMTPHGTFIINGAERVVVCQLLRSPGVYFTLEEDATTGRELCLAKLIPDRGAWLEFEISNRDVVSVKLDGKRKIAITTLLRAIGYSEDEKLYGLFQDVDTDPNHNYIRTTLEKEPLVTNQSEASIDIYKRLRPGEPPIPDNAKGLVDNLLFNFRRYDLGRVGRYKLNKKLKLYRNLVEEVVTKLKAMEFPQDILESVDQLTATIYNDERALPPLRQLRDKMAQTIETGQWGEPGEGLLNTINSNLSRLENRVLCPEDMVLIVRHLLLVNNKKEPADDIDHLGNRRVRTVGELIQNQFRIGLLRLERVVKERMSIVDPKLATPANLINIRPVVAAMREFFGGSQLSQFMDQTNPVSELTHKRRLSALGPGGLSRERAGFDVRDVHHSHYGRICPIETPEGPNIGLIGSLATYSRINQFGFIETPYRQVIRELPNTSKELEGCTLQEKVVDQKGRTVANAGVVVSPALARRLAGLSPRKIAVVPFVSHHIEYLTADREEEYTIAQANAKLNSRSQFLEGNIEARRGSGYVMESPDKIDFMDVSPKQVVSVVTSLIPFLEHNDANRALMGSNMQRQAVPLLRPEAPVVGTGMEYLAARDSGQVIFAQEAGDVVSVTGKEIRIKVGDTEQVYPLVKFARNNQGTCFHQRALVNKGDKVEKGQLLADSSATDYGELALGQNVLCAFMIWEGYNFEDAVIISESLAREDKFTSIHIEKHEIESRETKLGVEEVTRDIPNVGEESLRDLDERGVIRIGAQVGPGDILVGKITPKGETELSAEEKLLRAIFGEKARDVKDTSLRVPHGEHGKVIDVREFSRDKKDELPAGVIKLVRVWIAQKRKVSVGDKMAGRHGNKGVIARILPIEDMPFLPDGRHVELVLNPIGVPSRMNVGQILETHLAKAAQTLGFKALCPVFDGAKDAIVADELARAWLVEQARAVNLDSIGSQPRVDWEKAKAWVSQQGQDAEKAFSDDYPGEARLACLRLWLRSQGIEAEEFTPVRVEEQTQQLYREKRLSPPIFGKVILRDGRTGEPFDQPVTVGQIYLLKLIHLVEDKIHARSTGPYSLITQQPLGGKAQFGGQRFGEMEVWALEAYGAAHILQELLTVKSDDVTGRARTYESVVKGEDIQHPGVPESFKVLMKELQSLGLAVEVLNEAEEKVHFAEEEVEEKAQEIRRWGGLGLLPQRGANSARS